MLTFTHTTMLLIGVGRHEGGVGCGVARQILMLSVGLAWANKFRSLSMGTINKCSCNAKNFSFNTCTSRQTRFFDKLSSNPHNPFNPVSFPTPSTYTAHTVNQCSMTQP